MDRPLTAHSPFLQLEGYRRAVALLIAILQVAACTATNRSTPPVELSTSGDQTVPQRPLVIAFRNEVSVLEPSMNSGGSNSDFDALTNAYLAYLTPEQRPVAYLAADLPTLDKGSWKVLSDGRMETTYTIKRNAGWQDGAPITAHDFVFAHRVRTDPQVPAHTAEIERRIATARAADDYTLVLDWKNPYLWAGMVHGDYLAPLPRHLLEDMYLNRKERFVDGPHWREEYVGSGPYRVQSWDPGVEIAFRAHDGFVLGKPRIPQILIRFVGDSNAIVANLRAGAIDASFGSSSLAFPQGKALEEAGWPGMVEYWRGNPRAIEFQQRDWGNLQRAVLDVRVRRALLHAIDRQAMVDSLYDGKTKVWDVWFDSSDPAFPAVERAITRYEFSPAKAEALLREAGWIKGADGVARNAPGQPLSMSLLNYTQDIDVVEGGAIADFWKLVGAPTEQLMVTPAQLSDAEYRTKFPAASYGRRSLGYRSLGLTTPTPENHWSGFNYSGWSNPTVQGALSRALATVDVKEREPLYVEAFKAWTEDAVIALTHLQPRVIVYARELSGPTETWVGESAMIWNSWEWSWTSAR